MYSADQDGGNTGLTIPVYNKIYLELYGQYYLHHSSIVRLHSRDSYAGGIETELDNFIEGDGFGHSLRRRTGHA